MSKEVKRFYIMPGSVPALLSGDPAYTPMTNRLTDVHTVPLVLASDYDALLAERDALKQLLAETRTSMIEAIHWEDLTPARKRIETALQGEQP
ncbi:hypothetical protein [Stutzerimonas stutzeri]|uniref:hypothetical protein n=1 Tax=Stutzerimonas stutzeri TaxID=316 RepID=UPI000D21BA5C|nr:hypothetical protein [Stutzerimonas stutzeri]AVX13834.1 hypothetical protein CXB48_14065 [Stutzerimonas stutzeri]